MTAGGVSHDISVGDALCVLSHRVLFQLVDAGVPAGLVLALARYFDDMLLRINEGQHLVICRLKRDLILMKTTTWQWSSGRRRHQRQSTLGRGYRRGAGDAPGG